MLLVLLAWTSLANPAEPTASEVLADMERQFHEQKAVRLCFVPLFESGSPPSQLEVVFTVGETGRAEDLEVASEDPVPDSFEDCMRDAVAPLVFETAPRGEEQRFPFVLNG